MTDSLKTVECPRDRWVEHFPHCWLCGGSGDVLRVPAEVAATYRMGGMIGVADLLKAYPVDYPDLRARVRAAWPSPAMLGGK